MDNNAFDWDDFIEDDSEGFSLLEPGEYEYVVTDYEKTRSKAGNPVIILTLEIGDPIGSKTNLKEYVTLIPGLEWKISQVLRSLGLKKRGEKVPLRVFEKSKGRTGRCEIIVETKKDQSDPTKTYTNNKIKRFLDPPSQTEDFSW